MNPLLAFFLGVIAGAMSLIIAGVLVRKFCFQWFINYSMGKVSDSLEEMFVGPEEI